MTRSAARRLSLLFSIVVAACDSPVRPRDEVAFRPQLAISDGSHQGNPHFFFLPPLVANPRPSGTLDPTLSPLVEICRFVSGSCAEVLARYTMTTGPGSETVRLDPGAGHYLVNWHTDDFRLDPGAQYRIRVLLGGSELGYLDLVVAAAGGGVKNIQTSEIVALVNGRTVPIRFRIETGAAWLGSFALGPDVPAAIASRVTGVSSLTATVSRSAGLVAMPLPGVPGLLVARDAAGIPLLLGFTTPPGPEPPSPLVTATITGGVLQGTLDETSTAFTLVRSSLMVLGDLSVTYDEAILTHPRLAELRDAIHTPLAQGVSPLTVTTVLELAASIAADIIVTAGLEPTQARSLAGLSPDVEIPVGNRGTLRDNVTFTDLDFANRTFIHLDLNTKHPPRPPDGYEQDIALALAPPRNFCVLCWPPFGESITAIGSANGRTSFTVDAFGSTAGITNLLRGVSVIGEGALAVVGLKETIPRLMSCALPLINAGDTHLRAILAFRDGLTQQGLGILLDGFLGALRACAESLVIDTAGLLLEQVPLFKVISVAYATSQTAFFLGDLVLRGSPVTIQVCQTSGRLRPTVDDCGLAVKLSCEGAWDETRDKVGFLPSGASVRCQLTDSLSGAPLEATWQVGGPEIAIEPGANAFERTIVVRNKGRIDVTATAAGTTVSDFVTVFATDVSGDWSAGSSVHLRLAQNGTQVSGYFDASYFGLTGEWPLNGQLTDCGTGSRCLVGTVVVPAGAIGDVRSITFGDGAIYNPTELFGGLFLHRADGTVWSVSSFRFYPANCDLGYLTNLIGYGGSIDDWALCVY